MHAAAGTLALCMLLFACISSAQNAASCVAVGRGTTADIAWTSQDNAAVFFPSNVVGFSGEGVAVQDDAGLTRPLWVAVGFNKSDPPGAGADPIAFHSSDGAVWTRAAQVPLTGALRNVWYSAVHQLFVLVGCCGPSTAFRAGPFTAAYSRDGVSWTGVEAFDIIGIDVAYAAQRDLWVAVGDALTRERFAVAWVSGSPARPRWNRTMDVAGFLSTARGVAYSINHDLWFVIGRRSAGSSVCIVYNRDPTDPSQWKPIVNSATSLFPQGFRIASFNGTVIAAGDNLGGVTASTLAVYDAFTAQPSVAPVFVPTVEGVKFFNRTRGIVS